MLVTSAKSNTSVFSINALKSRNVNLYASSTSKRFESEQVRRGVKEVLVIAPEVKNFLEHPRTREVVAGSPGFNFVIDPYFDITCGLYDQYLSLIQGNCIGLTSDLQQALSDVEAGTLDVIVDAIFGGTQVAEFLDRTCNSEDSARLYTSMTKHLIALCRL